MKKFFSHRNHLYLLLLVLFFVLLRFSTLNSLPVFADEAIYIRWAQLIIDDLQQYAFFPLNDGKTPLFIWLLVPFQYLFENQLIAARFVSLLSGIATMIVVYSLTKRYSSTSFTSLVAAFFVGFTPFWFFHHGMALMDGLLTLWLASSLSSWQVVLQLPIKEKKITVKTLISSVTRSKEIVCSILLTGVLFGMAILTKIPAVLFFPTFALFAFAHEKKLTSFFFRAAQLLVVGAVAGVLFFSLKLHSAFSQLFSRGSDFLFPISEVFTGDVLSHTIGNIPTYISYFWVYLTPGLMFLAIAGLFAQKNKKVIHAFFWSSVFFILPIALLGRVVYPRYLFPSALGFSVAAALSFESLVEQYYLSQKRLRHTLLYAVLFVTMIGLVFSHSQQFIFSHYLSADVIPFVPADREQYQTEWSSGHGIVEFAETLKARSKDRSIAVATEGTFGTLPDGLLLYFHRENVENIYIEGIGQPVRAIPEFFIERAKDFDEIYLLVNSHRMEMELSKDNLVAQYCRPFNAPCLQVWDITSIVN